jgi:hypothetical protein
MRSTASPARSKLTTASEGMAGQMDAFDIDRMFDGYVPEEQVAELRAENERLRAALGTVECPTCAERGYDNADYHRLHRAWCDSVAEVERLRAALEELLDEVSGGNEPSPEMLGRARAALEYK